MIPLASGTTLSLQQFGSGPCPPCLRDHSHVVHSRQAHMIEAIFNFQARRLMFLPTAFELVMLPGGGLDLSLIRSIFWEDGIQEWHACGASPQHGNHLSGA